MPYLTDPGDIRSYITQLTAHPLLWLDTEVADWHTSTPRLSLIQVLADAQDITGNFSYILDVLDRPELVHEFVEQIMSNAAIEKVFHNARYDLQYLGSKQAENVTCTYRMAQRISKKKLGISNRKLKTLAKELCHFTAVDAESQTSDWGMRPLSEQQLCYARMDTVYLAHVHQYLLEFSRQKAAPVVQPL